jgi:hypothetical protein
MFAIFTAPTFAVGFCVNTSSSANGANGVIPENGLSLFKSTSSLVLPYAVC